MLPKSLQKLIEELHKLPSIGPKSAERLAFYMLYRSEEANSELANAVAKLKGEIITCDICGTFTEKSPCEICESKERDKSIICVVEDPMDMIALEKTGQYKGQYHCLGGVLSPGDGIGPDDLKINELKSRITKPVEEVILATNPTMEGETTAMYLQKVLKESNNKIKITRIARGLPVGGDLEYADEITIARSMEGRKEY
jgi:recombination protein RecR